MAAIPAAAFQAGTAGPRALPQVQCQVVFLQREAVFIICSRFHKVKLTLILSHWGAEEEGWGLFFVPVEHRVTRFPDFLWDIELLNSPSLKMQPTLLAASRKPLKWGGPRNGYQPPRGTIIGLHYRELGREPLGQLGMPRGDGRCACGRTLSRSGRALLKGHL